MNTIIKHHTSNYTKADLNYDIFNLADRRIDDSKLYSVLCVAMNIIERGTPTAPSKFLKRKLRLTQGEEEHFVSLFSAENPVFGTRIKGMELYDKYPARYFYEKILPETFQEFPFIQQLFCPEVLISQIVPNGAQKFAKQQVDFYMPQAKLVIEVDGSQHREGYQRFQDAERDRYLRRNGIDVLRIPSENLRNYNVEAVKTVLKRRVYQFSDEMSKLRDDYYYVKEGMAHQQLLLSAVMRLQITILELCMSGELDLHAEKWELRIETEEVQQDYERAAIEDLFRLLTLLCGLADVDFIPPKFHIRKKEYRNGFRRVEGQRLEIHISVSGRETDLNHNNPQIIYVFNSWRQDLNYYKFRLADKIHYSFDNIEDAFLSIAGAELSKRDILKKLLDLLYGYSEYRSGQERIIQNVLSLNDTIGILPTGTGKSICYQIPALLQPCLSFVVCPIISLMVDQKQDLDDAGISHTAYVSGNLPSAQKEQILEDLVRCRYNYIFLSPERFQSQGFRDRLESIATQDKIQFGYAVIDEVHCMSEWGHNFRVSYLNLIKTIRRYCPEATIVGLTATASQNVLNNIMIEFGMTDRTNVISTSDFSRKELSFNVIEGGVDKLKTMENLIKRYQHYYPDLLGARGKDSRGGIIFTPNVNGPKGCFELSQRLSHDFDGADIRCFAGGMPKQWSSEDEGWDEYKRKSQDDFKRNRFTLMTATKAFGMGVNKKNIRYTIHYGIPDSLEALYQEAGRAGRDKNKASCTVIFSQESPHIQAGIEMLLNPSTGIDIEALKRFVAESGYGEDVLTQLYLLVGNLQTKEEECRIVRYIMDNVAAPGQSNVHILKSKVSEHVSLNDLQKELYHLSIIGVVRDWTVEWRNPEAVNVDFEYYSEESVYEKACSFVKLFKEDESDVALYFNEPGDIMDTYESYWQWYNDRIVASRMEALYTTMDACRNFKNSDEFKALMESYFELGEVSNDLGDITDEPAKLELWFKILNPQKIRESGADSLRMTVVRFLESYNNNAALNYISGILNLVAGYFDSRNGKSRLNAALSKIVSFDRDDQEFIFTRTIDLLNEIADEEKKEDFSETVLDHEIEGFDSVWFYNKLGDNYSLYKCLDLAADKLAAESEKRLS